jgi:hypothetical protein
MLRIDVMEIPESLKFTWGGFSGKRVGYVFATGSFALVPAHSFVSCQVSSLICGFGIILFFATAVDSLIVPRGTEQRFRPMAYAFVATVVHSLFTH